MRVESTIARGLENREETIVSARGDRGGVVRSTVTVRFGHREAEIPLPNGCEMRLGAPYPMSLPLMLGGSGAGAGSIEYGASLPGNFAPHSVVTVQAFIADPGASGGVSATNAIKITLP